MNLSMKQKQNHGRREQADGCHGQEAGGGMEQEVGVSRCDLLYIEWINNKVLLYSTENYMKYPMIKYNGKEYFKKNLYTYMYIYKITSLYSNT